MSKPVYWISPLGGFDDFGLPYDLEEGGIMYDAKTVHGPWANMTEASFRKNGVGRLGPDLGQQYQMQADGRWLKISG